MAEITISLYVYSGSTNCGSATTIYDMLKINTVSVFIESGGYHQLTFSKIDPFGYAAYNGEWYRLDIEDLTSEGGESYFVDLSEIVPDSLLKKYVTEKEYQDTQPWLLKNRSAVLRGGGQ